MNMFSSAGQGWTAKDISLIETVKKNPILYSKEHFFNRKPKLRGDKRSAWEEVSSNTNEPVAVCIRRFHNLKFRYAKIKQMIDKGQVSEEQARTQIKTWKYMDGTLDFLEPYLCEIFESRIPTPVETFFNNLNFNTTKREAKDNNISVSVKDPHFIEILNTYNQDAGIEPMSILPSNNNNENESSSNMTNETFNNPLIIEPETLKQSIKKEISDYETAENAITDLESPEHILPDMEVTPDPLEVFLINYNSLNDKGTDLKQYMKDLADVLCLRLAFEKRKHFLSQIDLLVSEMLEGNTQV